MQQFANNAVSALAGAISDVAVTMSVQPGHGARFPAPVDGDYFLVTLFDLVAGVEANHEIVKCTARAVDTLTIVRNQEGTAPRAFGAGAQVSGRLTAGTLSHLAQVDMPTTFTQPVTILTAAPGNNTTLAASTAFVTAAINTAVAALVASSPAALDTLNELAAALGNDANYATTTATAIGNRLRVDAAQGLTAPQKAQAVANLGLATVATTGAKADVGLSNVDNTSDVNKPVSTPTANALALKAPLASPTFTGPVSATGAESFRIVHDTGYISAFNSANTARTGYIQFNATSDTIFSVDVAQAISFKTSSTERARITASGKFLLGTTIDNGVDTLQVSGKSAFVGPAASGPTVSWKNGTDATRKIGYLYSDGGGVAVSDDATLRNAVYLDSSTNAVRFYSQGVERMRIDVNGNLLVGATSGTYHTVYKTGGEGSTLFLVGGDQAGYAYFSAIGNASFNAAASGFKVGSNTLTGRSINGSGSINASGTDYAEYMIKAAGVGNIAKGQVVGITAIGEVTDQWNDAVSFMVKTTNPSYVGGDTWGVGLEGDELEAARARVDRIAYAGQVPVNVYGAKPGQFIVPGRFGDTVGGVAVNPDDMTMPLYLRAVGIVQNILPDGRANIRVKAA